MISRLWNGRAAKALADGDPGNHSMKRSIFALAAAALGVMALSACENRDSVDEDYEAPPPMEAPVTPPEDMGPPVAAPDVVDPAPVAPPAETMPEDERTSEQSVQPDSETLFY